MEARFCNGGRWMDQRRRLQFRLLEHGASASVSRHENLRQGGHDAGTGSGLPAASRRLAELSHSLYHATMVSAGVMELGRGTSVGTSADAARTSVRATKQAFVYVLFA